MNQLKEKLIAFKEGDGEEIHKILMKEVYLLKKRNNENKYSG